jgi:hypothetical protein
MTTHLLVVGLLVMVTNGCLTPLSTLSPLRPPSHTPQLECHAKKRAENEVEPRQPALATISDRVAPL